MAGGNLCLRGSFCGFYQFPEFGIFLKCFILADFQTGSEQEIFQRMPAQNPVNDHAQIVPLKIYAVIAHAKPVQRPRALLQLAELVQLRAAHLLREAAKIAEDLQLQFLGHPRQFRRAGGRENDLKCIGHKIGSAYGNRTRLPALRRPCPSR
jgi:hypothetical protein